MKPQFEWKTYKQLTKDILYEILFLRQNILIFEQKCPYRDIDGLDYYSHHLCGQIDEKLIAYLRITPPRKELNIEKLNKFSFDRTSSHTLIKRVIVDQNERRKGIAKTLVKLAIEKASKEFPKIPIQLSSQVYIQKLYNDFGFVVSGDARDEGGIPHVKMIKEIL